MAAVGTLVKNVGGKLTANNSLLLICDIQEKFRTNIQYFEAMVENTSRVLKAFSVLGLPVLCTEQYPKGLGHTVAELEIAKYGIEAVPKTQFSMCVPEIVDAIKKQGASDIVLCGIEGHVCVQQTTLQLLHDGLNVHLVADAVSSRSMTDRLLALQLLRGRGASLTSTESVVLGLAGGSKHPKFKDLQKIILEPSHDTGLLQHLKL